MFGHVLIQAFVANVFIKLSKIEDLGSEQT